MNFGNMGFMEILLILVVVLLLFGARRLPEIGASFGKSITAFKKGVKEGSEEVEKQSAEVAKDVTPKDNDKA